MSPQTLRNIVRRAASALAGAGVAHARLVVLGGLLLTGLLAWYVAGNLAINTDTADMLDPELPFMQRSREFRSLFPQFNDLLVAVVEADSRAAAQDVADALAARLEGDARLRTVYRPGSGPYFDSHGLLYLSEDELWEIDDRLAEAQAFLGTVAADPSLRGLLGALGLGLERDLDAGEREIMGAMLDRIADVVEAQLAEGAAPLRWRDEFFGEFGIGSGSPREFVLVQPRFDYAALEPAKAALAHVRSTAQALVASQPDVRVRLTGSVAMENEELATVAADSTLTTVLSFSLVLFILVWGVRSPGVILGIVANLLLGLIATAAFAAAAIGSVNLISVCFAVLFIGMGVDFGLQFGLRYREAAAREPKIPALAAAAGGAGGALTLAALAAAISFFAFVPTDYRGLAELGLIAGVSMFIALLTTLFYLPAWLAIVPAPRPLAAAAATRTRQSFVVRFRRPLLLAVALGLVGGAIVAPRARFDFNPLNLRDSSTESVAVFRDLLADPATTPYTIQVLAADVEAAAALAARLEEMPEVDKAVTLSSLVPSDQDAKLAIIEGMRLALGPALDVPPRTPPTREVRLSSVASFMRALAERADAADALGKAAQRLLTALQSLERAGHWPEPALTTLERNVIGDLPRVIDRLRKLLDAGPVDIGDLPADLAERYRATDGRVRVEVYPAEDLASNAALRRFVRAVQAVAPDATDTPVMLLEGGDAVIEATITATALAMVATAVLLALWLRELVSVVLVLMPLTLALLMMVATSAVLDAPFNLANIIALPLLIGLNNAYGAYLVLRHRELGDVERMLRSSTPRAVFFSGMTTMASFGTLAVSSHPGTASMGVFISIAIVYALFFALVVLPAVLSALDARRLRRAGGTAP